MFTIQNFIKEALDFNESLINDIKNDQISEARINPVKRGILTNSIELTFAYYTANKNKKEVTKNLLNTIPFFEEAFIFDDGYGDYDQMIRLVSLAILCDIDLEEFRRITVI